MTSGATSCGSPGPELWPFCQTVKTSSGPMRFIHLFGCVLAAPTPAPSAAQFLKLPATFRLLPLAHPLRKRFASNADPLNRKLICLTLTMISFKSSMAGHLLHQLAPSLDGSCNWILFKLIESKVQQWVTEYIFVVYFPSPVEGRG